MKELTEEEFVDQAMALDRARKIFVKTGLTNNLSDAFFAYQKIFADREREIFLSTRISGRRPTTFLDKYERVKCPDCGSDMRMREVPKNTEGIKILLWCSNDKCETVLNSEQDMTWWMSQLKRKKT